jgi:hypothetical protein
MLGIRALNVVAFPRRTALLGGWVVGSPRNLEQIEWRE